jgi:hypothetical protein
MLMMKKTLLNLAVVVGSTFWLTNTALANSGIVPVIVDYLLDKSFVNKLQVPPFPGPNMGELIVESSWE